MEITFDFKDRQSARPNRYKVTTDNGETYYITLTRADEPTVVGTPLNAQTLNSLVNLIANHNHTSEEIFATGATVLSSHQYGDELPPAGTVGRLFFKKVGQ